MRAGDLSALAQLGRDALLNLRRNDLGGRSSPSSPRLRQGDRCTPDAPGKPMTWRSDDTSFSSSAPSPRPALHERALFGLAGQVVRLVDPHTQADPAAVLFTLLVAFGNLVGRGPHAVADGARHGALLSVVLVGATAGGKGSSYSQVMALLKQVDENWATGHVAKGIGSGEALIRLAAGLSSIDSETASTDKRLLLFEPEFSRVFAVGSRDGSTYSQILRDAWDGGALESHTKSQSIRAAEPAMSALGHITAHDLAECLSGRNSGMVFNGFANRILWVSVAASKRLPNPQPLPAAAARDLVRLLAAALAASQLVDTVRRTPAADE